jgi:putative ABC transport system ATP-binding protein
MALPRVILILDEPTAGLDAALSHEALKLIYETTQADRSACVIASHEVALAQDAGFRIVPMGHQRQYGVQHAYLGERT